MRNCNTDERNGAAKCSDAPCENCCNTDESVFYLLRSNAQVFSIIFTKQKNVELFCKKNRNDHPGNYNRDENEQLAPGYTSQATESPEDK